MVEHLSSLRNLELAGIHLSMGILSILLQLVMMDHIYHFCPVLHDRLVYFYSVMLNSLDRHSFSGSIRHTFHPFDWHLFIYHVVNVLCPFDWELFFPLNRHLPAFGD